jgi:serine/threonine protein kinase
MFQLTRAIAHANLSGLGVSHLDVRGENVVCVLEERLFSVRLTGWDSAWMTAEGFRDIGASVSARPELPARSMPCRAPELLFDQDDAVLRFAKCDVWSLGCVFVEMFSAKPFFRPEPTEMRMLGRLMRTLGTPSIDALMAISSPLTGEGQPRVAEDAHFMSFGRELLLRHKSARVWSSTFKNVGITRDECRLIEAMLVWAPTKRLSAASLFTCAYFDAVRIPSAGIARECSARAAVQFDCYAPFTDGELKGLASYEKSALRRQARVPTLGTRPLGGSHLGSSTLATIEDDDEDAE